MAAMTVPEAARKDAAPDATFVVRVCSDLDFHGCQAKLSAGDGGVERANNYRVKLRAGQGFNFA
jgi:hypothetical protein